MRGGGKGDRAQAPRARRGAAAAGLGAAFLALALSPPARSVGPESTETLYARAVAALEGGAFTEAIDLCELLADRGVIHPDASFHRGLAYVARVRALAEQPGDLGRAAAAFEEALLLDPDDRDAEHALDLVRAEVARRRSRRDTEAHDVRPTLDRVIVGLAREETWGALALVTSLATAAGLALRRMRDPARHLLGAILAPLGALALLIFAPLAWAARSLREETRAGVVIVPELRLTDEVGHALGRAPIPEAERVELGERRGPLVHVRWGPHEGWAPLGTVRVLARRIE